MDDKKVIFSMVNVSKTIPPQRRILKDIYLSFFYGAKIGIIGLNGVLRGGSWNNNATNCRVSNRNNNTPSNRNNNNGFRLVALSSLTDMEVLLF